MLKQPELFIHVFSVQIAHEGEPRLERVDATCVHEAWAAILSRAKGMGTHHLESIELRYSQLFHRNDKTLNDKELTEFSSWWPGETKTYEKTPPSAVRSLLSKGFLRLQDGSEKEGPFILKRIS